MPETTLHDAASGLYEHFGCGRGVHPYIQAIGEAENTGTIWAYLVRKPMAHERPIPPTWRGWPVKTRVIGRITIGEG